MKPKELKGKTVLVTGASRGIGREIALLFGEFGCNVVVNYLSSEEEAIDVKNIIDKSGGRAIVVRADVTDYEQAKKLVDFTVREFGAIHILVNNVGYYEKKSFFDINFRDWETIFKKNFYSALNMIMLVLPLMINQNWGRIINIASIAGIRGSSRAPHYASAKAALINLTKSLARIFGKYNILVNAVAPGPTKTDTLKRWFSEEEIEEIKRRHPMGKISKPRDIAEAVVYLALSDFINGETIVVSGGYLG